MNFDNSSTSSTNGRVNELPSPFIDNLLDRDEMRSSVLCPRRFIVRGVERPLFSITDSLQKLAIQPKTRKVVLGGIRSLLAENKVVLYSAPLIAVPFDLDLPSRIGVKPGHIVLQYRAIARSDIVLVKI